MQRHGRHSAQDDLLPFRGPLELLRRKRALAGGLFGTRACEFQSRRQAGSWLKSRCANQYVGTGIAAAPVCFVPPLCGAEQPARLQLRTLHEVPHRF